MFDAPPEAFGSYRVEETLGAGRFGPIYRGRDDATGLVVAIKVFDHPLAAEQAAQVAAYLEMLGRCPLDHPAIVPVIGAGVTLDRPWLAEPWFDAGPLESAMQQGPLPVSDVLERITHVAAALDFAAAVDVHHGALHPRDILIGSNVTAVAGLGMLQALSDAGVVVPMEGAYVSPQRSRGAAVTAADDVFSLAAITYELIFGSPVPAPGDPVASNAAVRGIDAARLTSVLEGALSADPATRPERALQLAAAVHETVIPVTIPAPPSAVHVDPEIPIRPTPVHHEPDLPLRAATAPAPARPKPAPPKLRPVTARSPEPAVAISRDESSPRLWLAVAATLAIGVLVGFAGGYLTGYRDATQMTAAARSDNRQPAPAATVGRDYTESVVPPASEPRAEAPAAESPRSQTPEQPPTAPSPTDPGLLNVDSRPRGARVFVDGRLIGTTPLTTEVPPGTHAVRIDLVGHRRWVATVDVGPGERERVAASLER